MNDTSSTKLARDCEATQIPAGTLVTLPAGTPVDITQTLGGSYTVQAMGSLFRVSGKDADALGLMPKPGEGAPDQPVDPLEVNDELVWKVLRTCYDPEIPVNIVDLGLVYDMRVEPLPAGNSRVSVKMTLTAPGCGMGATIAADAQEKLLSLPGVAEADVQLVWDPPWQPSMISPTGRAVLGLD